MPPVALYSPDPARGWLPWAWLTPILMILFNAVPVIALDGWMQSQHWSTPRGDPIGLAGVYALLWIGFAPTLAAVLAWVRFVEGRSLASIGLTGPAPLNTFLRGLAVGVGTIAENGVRYTYSRLNRKPPGKVVMFNSYKESVTFACNRGGVLSCWKVLLSLEQSLVRQTVAGQTRANGG